MECASHLEIRIQIGLTDRKRAESRQFSWVEVQEKGNKEGRNERSMMITVLYK
jgi:hypothetical protein